MSKYISARSLSAVNITTQQTWDQVTHVKVSKSCNGSSQVALFYLHNPIIEVKLIKKEKQWF